MIDATHRENGAGAVGLIGIGNVGHGVGKSLLRKGRRLHFLGHRSAERAGRMAALGGERAPDAATLAATTGIAILSLPGAEAVEAVVTGAGGLLEGARTGFVIVDCSTSLPDNSRRMAAACAVRGVHFLDAAVGRTAKEAEEGRLNLMVGGDAAVLAAVRPVLETFAENIFHMGPAGAGHAMKLINNYLALTHAVAAAESLALARATGMDQAALFAVINSGGLANRFFASLVEPALAGNPDGIAYSLEQAANSIRYFNAFVGDLATTSALGAGAEAFLVAAAAHDPAANLGALMLRAPTSA